MLCTSLSQIDTLNNGTFNNGTCKYAFLKIYPNFNIRILNGERTLYRKDTPSIGISYKNQYGITNILYWIISYDNPLGVFSLYIH